MDPEHYLSDLRAQFRKSKMQADRAIEQVDDSDLFLSLDTDSNSIAVIMKHMAGNMRSRWSDFLTSDGEKPDRNRDSEFLIEDGDSIERLRTTWEDGWRCLFVAIDSLSVQDLDRRIRIRGEEHTVPEALHRQLTHYAGHVGQIVLLARHFAGLKWESLSIPRGQSEQFNTLMRRKA